MSIRGLITTGLLDSVAEVITLGLDAEVIVAPDVMAKAFSRLDASAKNELHAQQKNPIHAHGISELE